MSRDNRTFNEISKVLKRKMSEVSTFTCPDYVQTGFRRNNDRCVYSVYNVYSVFSVYNVFIIFLKRPI